ncbi:hypothetical protein ACF1G0_28665 [Streptomyces sp. NPDC013953]|uniref:hypothetical protein n=1 Tax=Streptomyces sp. NPDC013953 TaxID=3364868 RepID=UPI0036F6F9D0
MSEQHKDSFEQYGPDGPLNDRTGNGIVNDGEGDDERGGDRLDGFGEDGFGGDEPALRRMLQGAVEDLRPSDGALDHLRRAVPARRARKRQALVGMAAAALLFGTAVPAFVHVASSDSTSDDRPVNAGHGEEAQGGTGEANGGEGGEAGPGGGPGGSGHGTDGAASSGQGQEDKPTESASGASDGTVGGTAAPTTSVPVSTPVCTAAQLGVAATQTDKPAADGTVYGSFRVGNVSGRDCVVGGDGTVGRQANGAADPAKITVVQHTAGDGAPGLPDPAQQAAEPLLLKASAAYEVKFAWVPSETCPAPTGGGDASPDPTPPGDGTSSSGSAGTAAEGTQPQLAAEDTPVEGSVTVSYTPDAGGPAVETTIPNACAGTVYHTAPRPAE